MKKALALSLALVAALATTNPVVAEDDTPASSAENNALTGAPAEKPEATSASAPEKKGKKNHKHEKTNKKSEQQSQDNENQQ